VAAPATPKRMGTHQIGSAGRGSGDFPDAQMLLTAAQEEEGRLGPSDLVPFGRAVVVREGTDATIVAYSIMVSKALKAPRTWLLRVLRSKSSRSAYAVPLDLDAVRASVRKTNRLIVAGEAPRATRLSLSGGGIRPRAYFRFPGWTRAARSVPIMPRLPHGHPLTWSAHSSRVEDVEREAVRYA